MAIKRWNANTSTWELVGTPGTVTPAAIGAAALSGGNSLTGNQAIAGELEASGLITSRNGLRVNGGSNANRYQLGPFYNFTDFQITHSTDNFASHTPRLTIDTSGNIGIGTTTPTGRMHISTGAVESGSYIPLRLTSTGTPGSPFTWSSSSMAAGMTSGMNNLHMIGQAESIRNSGYIGYRWSSSGSTSNLLTFGHFGVDNVVNIDGNGYLLSGYTSSNGAYRLQVNSQIFATSSSIATSDGRYKENVLPITLGLDIIDSLNPVSFNWKEHAVHNFPEGKTVGFIAQEVQEALSDYEWVDNIIKSNYNEEADEEFLGIAESNIIPLLVAAVKELRSELNVLKASML